jgi:hypothetical protein
MKFAYRPISLLGVLGIGAGLAGPEREVEPLRPRQIHDQVLTV